MFIQAENLLLGFVEDYFFCFSLLFLRCCFSCLINFECGCVCVCVSLPAGFVLLCLNFSGICSLSCLSGSSLNRLAQQQVCVIVGCLSGRLTANRATLARLRVYETAGMCLVPPGRER